MPEKQRFARPAGRIGIRFGRNHDRKVVARTPTGYYRVAAVSLSVLMCPAAQAHRPCAARSLQMLEQAARGGPRQVPAATIPAGYSKGDERRPSVRQKEPMACREMRIVDPDQAGGQREHLAGLGNGKPVLRLRGGFRQVDAIL